jgi:hypothetical protein
MAEGKAALGRPPGEIKPSFSAMAPDFVAYPPERIISLAKTYTVLADFI